MEITVKCFASLGAYQPVNGDSFPVQDGNTVQDLLNRLGLNLEEVKLVFVNGEKAPLTLRLNQGDRVGLFPAVGGG
ncbi:MAG TPA: MoaD/ThiS family protein [Desulfohalobiaceae bacterium]|nr:MoaD/ThiS family protein [Desulfohalobiaceae bacterium]